VTQGETAVTVENNQFTMPDGDVTVTAIKTDTYSVAMVPSKSGRQVWCVITDKYGNSVTSEIATLTMEP